MSMHYFSARAMSSLIFRAVRAHGASLHRARTIVALGPAILVALADTDAGNVIIAAQSGAEWGYRMLPLLLLFIPVLYMVQELSIRLGIFTGRGYGVLVREQYGTRWGWLLIFGLSAATAGTLVTEFSAIAGVGEIYGVPRAMTLSLTAVPLFALVSTGNHRRIEVLALVIGLSESLFFAVAAFAHPAPSAIARDSVDLPFGNRQYTYLTAALISAAFNPWIVFYQQSATVQKRLRPEDHFDARRDTAIGVVLTQLLTAAVVVTTAAVSQSRGSSIRLDTLSDVSRVLTHSLGTHVGRLIFSIGAFGAATVAAIVSSLALVWGVGEMMDEPRHVIPHHRRSHISSGIHAALLTLAAVLVWRAPNLIQVCVAAQFVNAFLLPLPVIFLIALGITVLPIAQKPRTYYLWLLVTTLGITSLLGLGAALYAVP